MSINIRISSRKIVHEYSHLPLLPPPLQADTPRLSNPVNVAAVRGFVVLSDSHGDTSVQNMTRHCHKSARNVGQVRLFGSDAQHQSQTADCSAESEVCGASEHDEGLLMMKNVATVKTVGRGTILCALSFVVCVLV
jgi:hypothetical protein